jgi:hypothetical protein
MQTNEELFTGDNLIALKFSKEMVKIFNILFETAANLGADIIVTGLEWSV